MQSCTDRLIGRKGSFFSVSLSFWTALNVHLELFSFVFIDFRHRISRFPLNIILSSYGKRSRRMKQRKTCFCLVCSVPGPIQCLLYMQAFPEKGEFPRTEPFHCRGQSLQKSVTLFFSYAANIAKTPLQALVRIITGNSKNVLGFNSRNIKCSWL